MRSAVITGTGIVSPLADSAADCVARICRADFPRQRQEEGEGAGTRYASIALDSVPASLRPRQGRLDRLCRLFLAGTYRALEAAQLCFDGPAGERVGLSFGTGLGCLLTNAEFYEKIITHGPAAASPRLFAYTVSSAAAGEVSIALGIQGPNLTMHSGLAAGIQAIGYGADLIRSGKADVMIAGGADALGAALVNALAQMGLLRGPGRPFADARSGVDVTEGAALVVLEEEEHAHRRGAPILARLAGYGMGSEPSLPQGQRGSEGIQATLRRALQDAEVTGGAVDLIVTGAQGSVLDGVELAALQHVLEPGQPLMLTPKIAWGECFAASGALSVALAAEWMQAPRSVAPGSAAYDLREQGPRSVEAPAARLALVESLCYSGPVAAALVARG